MNMKEILRTYVAEATYNELSQIKYDTLLFEEGIFDSMGLLGLINFLEEKFQVVAKDVDLMEENFRSIDTIAEFISRKQQVAV